MTDQHDQELLRVAGFGMDVEKFMRSELGRYLQRRAQDDISRAQDALLTVDPEDAKAVRALQNEAAVAERVLSWLGEAVTQGEQAARQFEAEG